MDFSFLWAGIIFFGAVLLVHILLWRLFRPKGEIKPLFLTFLIVPALIGLGLWKFYPIMAEIDLALAAMVHLSLSVVYIQTYPAIATVIPSFRVLELVNRAGADGLSAEQITEDFGSGEMVGSRVELMLEDSLIVQDEAGNLGLSGSGNLLASVFLWYRSFLGLEEGEG